MADPQRDPREAEPQRRPTAEILPPGDDFDVQAERSLGELAVNQELTVVQERGLFGDLITAQAVGASATTKILQRSTCGRRWPARVGFIAIP